MQEKVQQEGVGVINRVSIGLHVGFPSSLLENLLDRVGF
jgi:hypothetical protein